MTPPLVSGCIRRRCTKRWRLRGKNLAVVVGFFLESLSGPLASFALHFQLDLPQGRRTRRAWFHGLAFCCGCCAVRKPNRFLSTMGQCKMRPGRGEAEAGLAI